MQPPVLPEDGTTRLTAGDEASSSTAVKDTSVPEPIWDDEDTKTFYECLPDLRSILVYGLNFLVHYNVYSSFSVFNLLYAFVL
ncbi:hypothetical protein Bca52824_044886 [Brassica carinata]|uniref:Uncharacterized protein n=1 Tax=Brassica carinata TaxID=52824 RepID=A0A8X7RCR4_BRACI|nr:hypothetical protein Bca52824_044886 [Brassica carinata]